jgi:flagellar motility protein MotE (MotC chaperone)
MADTSPTLADPSPTLQTAPPKGSEASAKPDAGTAAKPAADGAAAAPAAAAGTPAAAGATPDAPAAAAPADAAMTLATAAPAAPGPNGGPGAAAAVAAAAADPNACPPASIAAAVNATPQGASALATAAPGSATPSPNCDAVPMALDLTGKKVPLGTGDGTSLTEQTLLQRLAERRAQLDKRESDLNLREGIVAAAEKQMQDRADALKALEAQIAQLNAEKSSMADTQFAAVVTMYATMKPQEAAGIFDGLDMGVLIRVAKAMDPKKMSPILAKMDSARAQELTKELADADPPPSNPVLQSASADPNALPQIVGH